MNQQYIRLVGSSNDNFNYKTSSQNLFQTGNVYGTSNSQNSFIPFQVLNKVQTSTTTTLSTRNIITSPGTFYLSTGLTEKKDTVKLAPSNFEAFQSVSSSYIDVP
ncbi:unnamed protein product, partial [Rotaria sordida]